MKSVVTLAAAAALLALALMAGGAVQAATASAACAHSTDTHATAKVSQLENALACLINAKRHDRGKARLDRNGKLDEASGRHSRTMVRKDCFSHKCPGEKDLDGRIRDSGYLNGATSWHYAESFGCALTPKAMLGFWMHDDFSRENLMKGAYNDLGVGAARGSPGGSNCHGEKDLTTFTAVTAWRKP
jgi:uncharacterized protein YkwD